MLFEYAYHGHSAIHGGPHATRMSFVPDAKRAPTSFNGTLRTGIAFREAISALHDVVVSDLRQRPRDREAYKAWLAQQEEVDLVEVLAQTGKVRARVRALEHDLGAINEKVQGRMAPFYRAQARYFDYLYKRDLDAWFVLDPVITVHPDQIFFECFSQDESSYGCLASSYEAFDQVGEMACGTTNIDYSAALYDEFQKIRTYKSTRFEVDPSGFEVTTTGEDALREVKIDLPDTWVRGFLQVSSAMTLPAVTFDLHPLDLYNFCFFLRRHKESRGPRSMRYCLTPGEPVKVVFEPWEHEVVCPRSIYQGPDAREIRVWGRRRLHILERLISVARKFTVHLLGKGMPSFYVADCGSMVFTLGLSGWTANDWATAGNFDLMAPRADVDTHTQRRVFEALGETWLSTPDALATRLGLDRATVLGALGVWTQAGRAIFDLHKGVYRVRELSREPLPTSALRFANPREEAATRLVDNGCVRVSTQRLDGEGHLHLSGTVRDGTVSTNTAGTVGPPEATLQIDADERLRTASCDCSWHRQNRLRKGPCEHILAVRMQSSRTG